MKTIVNCTICGVACVDSFTMLYPQCTDCGGEDHVYDEPADPTEELHKESMGEFYEAEIEEHYGVSKAALDELDAIFSSVDPTEDDTRLYRDGEDYNDEWYYEIWLDFII